MLVLPIVIALLFLVFTFSYYPFREKLQFDTDEGLNLMRSMLVSLGHPLYNEVSSDQPPLFTQILALLFQITGFDVNPARFLVLLFSALLVWAGAQFLQLTSGRLAAILFLPLIVMTPRYLNLSVAVMIGIPSIALALASMLFVIVWHQTRRDFWLVLSGFMLSLSVLVKLFTGFVAPIFVIGMTVAAYVDRRENGLSWRMLRPALIWSSSFVLLAILLGAVLIGPQNLSLIILPSLHAPAQEQFQADYFSMNTHLQAAVPLLVLGSLGTIISIHRRRWLILYPLGWAVLAYILFNFYSPVFYHHQLLITVPMVLIAAAGFGEGILSFVDVVKSQRLVQFQTVFGIATLIAFIWVCNTYLPVLDEELMNKPRYRDFNLRATPGRLRILRTMAEHADQTNWIVTDMPIYAFRVGRPVPPILATFSEKRLATGSLTDEDILRSMNQYQPEQVLIARFQIPVLEQYLLEHYTLILSRDYLRLYLRNDLVEPSQ